jgi:uncharacterized protein YvpB
LGDIKIIIKVLVLFLINEQKQNLAFITPYGGSEQKYIQEALDSNWVAQLVQILMLSSYV